MLARSARRRRHKVTPKMPAALNGAASQVSWNIAICFLLRGRLDGSRGITGGSGGVAVDFFAPQSSIDQWKGGVGMKSADGGEARGRQSQAV